jgi:hypothetical protein
MSLLCAQCDPSIYLLNKADPKPERLLDVILGPERVRRSIGAGIGQILVDEGKRLVAVTGIMAL